MFLSAVAAVVSFLFVAEKVKKSFRGSHSSANTSTRSTKRRKAKREIPSRVSLSRALARAAKDQKLALSDKLLARMGTAPRANSRVAAALAERGVSRTPEFERIAHLPRRILDLNEVENISHRFRRDDVERCEGGCDLCRHGVPSLWPIQSAALLEMERANGLLGFIGVGHGKTGISLLAALVMRSKCTVLLVPPELKDQLIEKDIPRWGKHYNLPPLGKVLHVIAYSELSSAKCSEILEQLRPDLIVCDEADNLKRKEAARTRRFMRYAHMYEGTRYVFMSGSLTTESIKDYSHFAELALRKNSPLPVGFHELNSWADAIDVLLPGETQTAPGALEAFCDEEESVRSGFRRRLTSTPGVISTSESAVNIPLRIELTGPELPSSVKTYLTTLRKTWSIEDEELEDGMAMSRVSKQLALGFYYRWKWPASGKDRVWLDARAAWHKELRQRLLHTNIAGMDSAKFLTEAAADGSWASQSYAAWAAVEDREEPPVEAVWIDDFALRSAEAWAKKIKAQGGVGIIWYAHRLWGPKLAQMTGLPIYEGGDNSIIDADPEKQPVIIASMKSHGVGKNLQKYSENLVVSPFSNGKQAEQVCGRTHRPGQDAEVVPFEVWTHTPETKDAFKKALAHAQYIQETTGVKQKLLMAEIVER